MPSAEEKTYLFKVMPEKTDFLTRDVDILVSKIKENLRLTAGFKAKSSVLNKNRPSPYIGHSRKDMRRDNAICGRIKNNNNDKNSEDPYETLRELLKQGRLINEAVKKLKTMNFDGLSDEECHDLDDDDDDWINHRGYRRKTYYYDSEDEPLPTVYDDETI